MIAARILGEEAVGLASLLNSRLGLELDKKYQRANWGIRPLPQEMLDYACQDSHSLYELRNIIAAELKEKGLWELALEDFRLACEVEAHSLLPFHKRVGRSPVLSGLDVQEAAILQALCDFREEQASRQNVPPFKVMTNETLMNITKERPETFEKLKEIRGVSPRVAGRYGRDLMSILQRAETIPPLRKPIKTRPE